MAKKKRSKKPKTVVFGMNASKGVAARKPDTAGEVIALHMRHLDRLKKRLLSASWRPGGPEGGSQAAEGRQGGLAAGHDRGD